MPPGSVGRKKHMHRSPFLAAALFLLTACVWAQQPASSEPKDSSGTPQTPMATPQTPNPAPSTVPQTQPPAPGQPSSTSSPTGSAAAKTSNTPTTSIPAQPPTNQNQQPLTNSKAKQDAAATANVQPGPPPQPKTEILDSSATSGGLSTSGHDPILDPPPFPSGGTTLVGGTIRDVDRIRNRLVVNVFGGGRWKVSFDERTHIFRNGAETTQLALKKGERSMWTPCSIPPTMTFWRGTSGWVWQLLPPMPAARLLKLIPRTAKSACAITSIQCRYILEWKKRRRSSTATRPFHLLR